MRYERPEWFAPSQRKVGQRMPSLNQLISVPLFFKIGAGLSGRFRRILDDCHVAYRSIAFISGAHFSAEITNRVIGTLAHDVKWRHIVIDEASEEAVLSAYKSCRAADSDLVVSVGGGSVIDVGKRLQRLFGIPNIVVPTIVSNDGLMSPISVLRGLDGKRDSFPGATPLGAVIDTDLIRQAPVRYLVAAAGDVLSNLSASIDWRRLYDAGKAENFNDLAFHLSFGSAQSLINFGQIEFDSDEFVECIIRSQIYSGIAMSLAGSSRPCSGAEHLISHAIDNLHLSVPGALHGAQVGSISLFIIWLLRKDVKNAIAFAERIGLPLDWKQLYPDVASHLHEVLQTARTVRPGRTTILDAFSDDDLIKESEDFNRMCIAPRSCSSL
jgi:glycerol-1-phosphate dehydrogenase [NAD(P)+]